MARKGCANVAVPDTHIVVLAASGFQGPCRQFCGSDPGVWNTILKKVTDLLSTWARILFDTSIFGMVYLKKINVKESGRE